MWSRVILTPAESWGTQHSASELFSHEIKALFMSSKENFVFPPKGELTALQINQGAKLFPQRSSLTVTRVCLDRIHIALVCNDSLPWLTTPPELYLKKTELIFKVRTETEKRKNLLNPFFCTYFLYLNTPCWGLTQIWATCVTDGDRVTSLLSLRLSPPQSSLSLGPDVLAKCPPSQQLRLGTETLHYRANFQTLVLT